MSWSNVFLEITFWPTITNFQCYNCESEAIYWCCWNAAYCSTECQQNHWHRWKFSQTDLPSSIRFEILNLHFVFSTHIVILNGLYIMYIICALQGTQEKLSEEALRAAKESEGEDCSPHMWSEYLAVTQTTTTTTKPLQIIILRLLSELVKWSFVDAAKYLVAQFSPKTERKRTFHRSSNPVEANISQNSDWHLVDMFSVPIG